MLLSLAMASAMLVAMPTREEVDKAASLVQDIMKPEREALEAGRKTCAEVAQAALALADKSESEAEKLLLAKGAYNLYAHEGSFDKAVGAMKTLRDMIPDLSPQVVANIIESSFGDVSNTNDVRLCGLLEEAKTCVRYQDELAAILAESEKDPRNGALHLRIAEKYAFLGPWTKAVEEFTKGDDRKAAAMAEAEREVRVGLAAKEIADFWWDYPAQRGKELERAFRLHAAEIYRRLLVEGALAGLDKVQTERRVEEAKKYAALFFQRGGWFGIGVKRLKVSLAGDVELELIRCPAGEFTMGYRCWEKYGSPYNRESRKVHQVKLTRDFFLGRFPVTYAQWHAVMKRGDAPPGGLADVPAGNITVPEMEAFCEKLTERFGRYLDGRVFRLPTEAEWEYASKGGRNLEGLLGFDWAPYENYYAYNAAFGRLGYKVEDHARVSDVGQELYKWNVLPVGKFEANEWGFQDVVGNAREVTADMMQKEELPYDWPADMRYSLLPWKSDVQYSDLEVDPLRKGERHVVRGGFWRYGHIGPSYKFTFGRDCRLPAVGFRVCIGAKLGDWNNAAPAETPPGDQPQESERAR